MKAHRSTVVPVLIAFSIALSACGKVKYVEGVGSTDEGLLNIDPQSVRETNGTVIANTSLWHFGEGTPMNNKLKARGAPFHVTGYSSVIQIDCNARMYREINRNYHLSNGERHHLNDVKDEMILPESPAEKAMDFMCLPGWRRSLKVMLNEIGT